MERKPRGGPAPRSPRAETATGTDTSTEEALRIAIDARLPFAGLRGRAIDYRLFHYVPFELAQREAVVPLSLDGDTLTVAAATGAPDLTETRAAFPALPLRLVIAPRREIFGILDQIRSLAA
jgi:hypothetical protein